MHPTQEDLLATCSDDWTIKFWSVLRGCCLLTKSHKAAVLSIAWSPCGQALLSGSTDKTIKLWLFNTQESVKEELEATRRAADDACAAWVAGEANYFTTRAHMLLKEAELCSELAQLEAEVYSLVEAEV